MSSQPSARSATNTLRISAILCALFVSLPEVAAEEELQRFEFQRIRMGIPVSLTVYASTQESANEATNAAYARLKQLDQLLSDYDDDSELMRVCKGAAVGVPQAVSPDFWLVLQRAQQLAGETDGAFDVTVGPLVKLWRSARRSRTLPAPDRLAAALSRTGYQKLRLDEERQTVTFLQTGMELDFGAIAKGYAADEALRILRERGLHRALVAVAGDLVAGDPPPGRSFWRVEIEPLRGGSPHGSSPERIQLVNGAVSTSGDAYRFVEIEGVRYSHIVNPRTGIGLTTPCSVTVFAKTGIAADSLSTAVAILGREAGSRLLEKHPGTEMYFVESQSGDERRTTTTPGWAALRTPD
ncbi:FAD:protein FMN transferase [Planctomicrobium sp. SH664]|uniref:FAD:protein FMN transferase n=1 Tax=Planctomicrobium sp. SH664 TaxID=3448125 RepID=UPI003F5B770A